jgi:NADH-quinone oxidoreductase subunit J
VSTGPHYQLAAAAAAASTAPTTGQSVTYWVLAVLAVLAAFGMIFSRKAVHCAMLLAVVMLSLAVLYATQGAPFLAFVQVIVYTGAVLMLFLFVLMLVGVSASDSLVETIKGQRLAAGLTAIALVVLLLGTVGHATLGGVTAVGAAYGSANLTSIARLIFTKYVYAFEVTSALLITAALGAMVLAHRERTEPKPTQRELARRRVTSAHPTPLPGPGTYALHNAVDRPALLPDGRVSELSVSPVIAGRRPHSATEGPVLPAALVAQARTASAAELSPAAPAGHPAAGSSPVPGGQAAGHEPADQSAGHSAGPDGLPPADDGGSDRADEETS